jgi:hypothetical protein
MNDHSQNTLYDINEYSDEQLYNILNLSNPTDTELEAQILQMIRRYSNIQNESGNNLARFFNQVYDRFFETEKEEEEEPFDQHSQIEGFETIAEAQIRNKLVGKDVVSSDGQINYKKYTKQTEGTSSTLNLDNITQSKTIQPSASQTESIIQTQNLDYSKDKTGMNPLLKQTIKRIINIDSNFRNKVYYPLSTDFTFNLSEPLRDVLSLKLYSVQIPFTWYTISNNYGSNLVYLKGVTTGIDDGSKDYKIEIPKGNYNSADFSTKINESIASIKANNTDVSFGQTSFSFDTISSRSTFTVDIQNIYNEPYYQIVMEPTLATYLQYKQTEYPLNTIHSILTQQPIDLNYRGTYTIDASVNYFTVIHYTDLSNQYETNSIILNRIPVVLSTVQTIYNALVYTPVTGQVKREDVPTYINNGIQNQPLLDISHSTIDFTVNSSNQYSYTMTLQLNKYLVQLYPNSKLCIQFPSKTQYPSYTDVSFQPFWCDEYINLTYQTNKWVYVDVSNIDLSYKQFQWNSVGISENGQYQTALVSIKNIFQQNSNIYYSSNYGTTWNVAKDINGNTLPTFYIWNRVVLAGDGTFQFAFSTNNSKLWFSKNQGRQWKDSNLNYQWVCLDASISTTSTIIAATGSPNKMYYLTYDPSNNILLRTEILQLTNDDPDNLGLKPQMEFNSTDYNWNSISISQNGIYQVATTFNVIYYSSDSGVTWAATYLIYNGEKITNLNYVKTTYNENVNIPKYVSVTTNNACYILDPSNTTGWLGSSRSWVKSPQSFNYIQSISISDDSSIQVISDNTFEGTQGQVYTSSNYGYTWTTKTTLGVQTPNIGWKEVAISKNNGLHQTGVAINDVSGGIWSLYFNNVGDNVVIYDSIRSFLGFEQKTILITTTYPSQDSKITNPILQYFFYNFNNLYSENYYNYIYNDFQVTTYNNVIKFIPEVGHNENDKYATQQFVITLTPDTYTMANLLIEINKQISSISQLVGTKLKKISSNYNGYEYLLFQFNINKIYTSSDYKLVFYDVYSFVTCFFGATGVRNITWDNTLGWILGYRDFTEYYLTLANMKTRTNGTTYYEGSLNSTYTSKETYDTTNGYKTKSVAALTGDTSVNTTLYNYFYIILDDYNQNHLNDGVVINIQSESKLPLPSYSNLAVQSCNSDGTTIFSSPSLTQNQLTATNTMNLSHVPDITSQSSIKQKASYPSIQDVFAFIPMKTNGLANGSTYIEFGGTLQNQSRLYFGPVNIHRMSVKLVTNKGDTLDLNNADWSFSFECEQLYRSK